MRAQRSGSSPTGRVILVAVDGEQPGYSVGHDELRARAGRWCALGAVTAGAVAYGERGHRRVRRAAAEQAEQRRTGRSRCARRCCCQYFGRLRHPPSVPVITQSTMEPASS